MKSITYYLTLLVIKLKGVKREFSKDPVNYEKLRKEDLHDPGPNKFLPNLMKQFQVSSTTVTELKPLIKNQYLIIYCHGGAFVYGPVQHHWDSAQKLVSKTGCSLWMADYPKAPEKKIPDITKDIELVYEKALENYNAKNIILFGDSVGGTLIVGLVQRLILNQKPLPQKLILLSPVVDATLENLAIEEVDSRDPILSKKGVLSAKKMCAGSYSLSDPLLSPINGSFKRFPETILFLAENDITYPDQQILVQKLKAAGVKFKTVTGEGMPHIWPILPVMKEAREAFSKIISEIKEVTGE